MTAPIKRKSNIAPAPMFPGSPTRFHTRFLLAAATRPSFAKALPREREPGMPDARCTRGLVCKAVRKNAHEHTGSAEAIRHSLRNGLTAYAALSPATNSSCHRHRRIEGFDEPGWVRKTSADLTPATGARTTRFCRTPWRRSSGVITIAHGKAALQSIFTPDAAASTASHPNVRDDGRRPSSGMRRRSYALDLGGDGKRNIFVGGSGQGKSR
jgi:hypothetical protein